MLLKAGTGLATEKHTGQRPVLPSTFPASVACSAGGWGQDGGRISHCVIFWLKPDADADAAEVLLAGCYQYLKDLPGVVNFHAGKMVPSHRPMVDQSNQAGLNVIFKDKAAEEAYQIHPTHLEFVEKVFKPLCEKAVIYDFA